MKKIVSLLIVLAMMMSTLIVTPVFADNAVTMNFDNVTSFEKDKDYIIGGQGYAGVIEATSEKDHTSGTGKSIVMRDRTGSTQRIKLVNAIPNSLLNKKVKVSAYVMSDTETKLAFGVYSDSNTPYAFEAYAIKYFNVKANEWTKFELEFDYKDEIANQIGIAQEKEAANKPVAKTVYIDDITIEEASATAVVPETPKTEEKPSAPKYQTETEISLDFDNTTEFVNNVDYVKGGGYNGTPEITNEKDHTTGSGKSVKFAERDKDYYRLKFKDVITPAMKGKTLTLSAWVYTDIDARVSIGAYSDVNTTYASVPMVFKAYDIKANEWTQIYATYNHTDEIVTQLGIGQENFAGEVAQTIYIDDIKIGTDVEVPKEEVVLKTENLITFDDVSTPAQAKIEVGGGAVLKHFYITDKAAYGIGGKSLLMTERNFTYARAKFMSAFDNLPQEKGTKYHISMMVMVADESPVDSGQFTIGVIDFLGSPGNGKEYDFDKNYNYTIKKGEWTKIERTYTHTGEEVYGISLDQTGVPGVEHEIISVKDMYVDNVCVKVSDEIPPVQPVLTTEELVNLANLGVQVFIDNQRLIFGSDKAPEIINGRTLVPLRKIFEKLGTSVYWDGATSTVTGKRGSREIKLTIGDTTAYIDGNAITLDVPAQILEGRTMVPVRFIAESLGCQVGWIEKSKRVDITSPEKVNEINVYADNKYQEIYGFGASANHNAGYIMNSSKEMQEKTMKALFDLNEGIGLNIMRLEVNPFAKGKDKSNLVDEFQFTINPAKDVWEMDADVHQIWYANEAEKYNPDIMYLASPWSPPSWMKVNDSVIGKTELPNELAKEHYDDYAEYLARWTKYYTENLGFDIKWVSVQNEPDGSTAYASCEYSDLQMVEVARRIMKKFKEEGITALVGLPESSTLISTNTYLKQIEKNSPDFLDEMQLILAHSYSYSDTNLDSTNMERFNVPLLQTEKNDGPSVKRVNNNDKLLKYSNEITDHLNHNYGAWMYWYGIRKVSNLGSQNSESLIDFNDETKEIAFADEYYSLGHFSKFIKPGSTRVASYSQNKDINVVTTIDETTGKMVLVVTNNGETDETVTIKGLSNAQVAELYRSSENEKLQSIGTRTITNGETQLLLKAKSITTIVEK